MTGETKEGIWTILECLSLYNLLLKNITICYLALFEKGNMKVSILLDIEQNI